MDNKTLIKQYVGIVQKIARVEHRRIPNHMIEYEELVSIGIIAIQTLIKGKTEELGVDAVFMTSGADKAIDVALKTVKMGGKILVFSSTPKNFGYANNEIYYKELTVMGSYSPSPKDLEDSFKLLCSRKVNVKNLTTTYPLEKVQEAFEDTVSNKIFKAYIKIGE